MIALLIGTFLKMQTCNECFYFLKENARERVDRVTSGYDNILREKTS